MITTHEDPSVPAQWDGLPGLLPNSEKGNLAGRHAAWPRSLTKPVRPTTQTKETEGEGTTENGLQEPEAELTGKATCPSALPSSLDRTKAKRLLLVSNDGSHERDRYHARYRTFNGAPTPQATRADSGDLPFSGFLGPSPSCKCVKTQSSGCSASCVAEHLLASTLGERLPLLPRLPLFRTYRRLDELAPLLTAVRRLSFAQLRSAYAWYFGQPLPSTRAVFPWLHGLHMENYAQRAFFGTPKHTQSLSDSSGSSDSDSGADSDLSSGVWEDVDESAAGQLWIGAPPVVPRPRLRVLMCVELACPDPAAPPLRNSVAPGEILQRIEYSRLEVAAHVRALLRRLQAHTKRARRLSAGAFEQTAASLTADCLACGYMPLLVDANPPRGVLLRNFHIQVNKAAECADFVVYCHGRAGGCPCEPLARVLRVAQAAASLRSPYHVFVLEPVSPQTVAQWPQEFTARDTLPRWMGADARRKTQLTAHGHFLPLPATLHAWDTDYLTKEKVETTLMLAALRVGLNVWAGNYWDHHQAVAAARLGETPAAGRPDGGAHGYCDPARLSLTAQFGARWQQDPAAALPPRQAHWQLLVQCHGDAAFPALEQLAALLYKYTVTLHRASEVADVHHMEFPALGLVGLGDCLQDNLVAIVNTCKLLHLYALATGNDGLAALVYCSDGYTELSLLVLCFIMYSEHLDLEAAVLRLHSHYGRPFYIFNTDLQVLRRLLTLLCRHSPARPGHAVDWGSLEHVPLLEISEVLLGPAPSRAIPRKLRLGYIAQSDSESDDEAPPEGPARWLDDVDGLLPSRILPDVYLGSLKHANNVPLLEKLGITKVISVGDYLHWLGDTFRQTHPVTSQEDDVLEILQTANFPVATVIRVKNLQDDGIDGISRALPRVLRHVSGKTLVHCRVGVLRSASVVIAVVMHQLGLSLAQAYMYVRVRRLNIVIQPNLRFMYELFKWEEAQNRQRARDRPGAVALRPVDWWVVCQEIKKLNFQFQ